MYIYIMQQTLVSSHEFICKKIALYAGVKAT